MTIFVAPRAFSFMSSLLAIALALAASSPATHALDIAKAATSSSITILSQDEIAAVVNPRIDTLSILRTDTGAVIATLPVGDEPRSVAVDRNRTTIFVANAAGSSVSMIPILNSTVANFATGPAETLLTGAEPWDVVVSPDSKRAFVSNSAQGTISVINAIDRKLIGQIDVQNSLCNDPDRGRRFQPRGLAINAASDRLYVTRFLSFTRAAGGLQASDIGKEGAVCAFNINTSSTSIADYKPFALITLPTAFSGFDVDRSGDGLPDPTFAFPNQLQNIVLRGNRAFLPSIGASPEGPLFHRTSIQSLISVFDNAETGTPFGAFSFNINQHAVQPEVGKRKLFFTNPAAMAFTTQSGAGHALVLSAGSDLLAKFTIDAANNMAPTVDWDTTRYIDLNDPSKAATSGAKAGFAPHGLAVLGDGSKAFIANQWSGNVSIVDLLNDKVVKVVRTAPLPASGSRDEILQTGAQLFFSSRGTFKAPAGATASHLGRLSQDGWMSCSSCHFNGLTDGVVWQFGTGPRKSLSLAGTVNPRDRNQQRILNYSAIFDEVEDFEITIRNTQGPGSLASPGTCETGLPESAYNPNFGLLIGDLGSFDKPPCEINPFIPRNAGRQQVKVDPPGATPKVSALTALREWVRFAVRAPNGPLNSNEIAGGVSASALSSGRKLFGQQCATCHGGPLWTRSIRDGAPPPLAGDITCETSVAGSPAGSACFTPALGGNPVGAQYLARFLRDVGSYNLGVAGKGNDIGANIGAPEKAARELVNGVAQPPKDALGFDFNGDGKGTGYSIPSLLGISMSQPYMHNGACESIACVVGDRDHRTGNGQFADLLDTATKRRNVTLFVESIDAQTTPFR